MKKKGWVRGTNITVSPQAHTVLKKEAKDSKPKRTLREHLNVITKVPKEA